MFGKHSDGSGNKQQNEKEEQSFFGARTRSLAHQHTHPQWLRDVFAHDSLTCILARATFLALRLVVRYTRLYMNECMKVTTRNVKSVCARRALSCYGLGFHVMMLLLLLFSFIFFCPYAIFQQPIHALTLLCLWLSLPCEKQRAQYTFQSKLQRIQIFLEH